MQSRSRLIRNTIFFTLAVGALALHFAELRADAHPQNRSLQKLQIIRLRESQPFGGSSAL